MAGQLLCSDQKADRQTSATTVQTAGWSHYNTNGGVSQSVFPILNFELLKQRHQLVQRQTRRFALVADRQKPTITHIIGNLSTAGRNPILK